MSNVYYKMLQQQWYTWTGSSRTPEQMGQMSSSSTSPWKRVTSKPISGHWQDDQTIPKSHRIPIQYTRRTRNTLYLGRHSPPYSFALAPSLRCLSFSLSCFAVLYFYSFILFLDSWRPLLRCLLCQQQKQNHAKKGLLTSLLRMIRVLLPCNTFLFPSLLLLLKMYAFREDATPCKKRLFCKTSFEFF